MRTHKKINRIKKRSESKTEEMPEKQLSFSMKDDESHHFTLDDDSLLEESDTKLKEIPNVLYFGTIPEKDD